MYDSKYYFGFEPAYDTSIINLACLSYKINNHTQRKFTSYMNLNSIVEKQQCNHAIILPLSFNKRLIMFYCENKIKSNFYFQKMKFGNCSKLNSKNKNKNFHGQTSACSFLIWVCSPNQYVSLSVHRIIFYTFFYMD